MLHLHRPAPNVFVAKNDNRDADFRIDSYQTLSYALVNKIRSEQFMLLLSSSSMRREHGSTSLAFSPQITFSKSNYLRSLSFPPTQLSFSQLHHLLHKPVSGFIPPPLLFHSHTAIVLFGNLFFDASDQKHGTVVGCRCDSIRISLRETKPL